MYACLYVCVHVCVSAVLGCCVDGDDDGGNTPLRAAGCLRAGRGVDLCLCGSLQGATSTVAGDSHASGECFVLTCTVGTDNVEGSRVVQSPARELICCA